MLTYVVVSLARFQTDISDHLREANTHHEDPAGTLKGRKDFVVA